jgi:hypothetical protein
MLIGCSGDATEPRIDPLIVLEIPAPALPAPVDSVVITLEGPSPRTITVDPGHTVRIEEIELGSYEVTIEGWVGDAVAWLATLTIDVSEADPEAQISVDAPAVFIGPSPVPAAATVLLGQRVRLTWSALPGAVGYRVEWTEQGGARGEGNATGASIELDLGAVGAYGIRVRPISRLGSVGLPSDPALVRVLPATHTLAVTRIGAGSVTSSPSGLSLSSGVSASAEFGNGVLVVLTAVPDAGSRFRAWSGACGGTAPTCQVSMTEPRTVGATFVGELTTTLLIPTQTCTVGANCAFTPVTANGGVTPYTFAVSGAALPAGLSFDPNTGSFGGTPASTATTSLTVMVTDAAGQTASAGFELVVAPPPGGSEGRIRLVSGYGRTDTINAKPSYMLVVAVLDGNGEPQRDVAVRFGSNRAEGDMFVAPAGTTGDGHWASYVNTRTDSVGRAAVRLKFGWTAGPAWVGITADELGLSAIAHYTVLSPP